MSLTNPYDESGGRGCNFHNYDIRTHTYICALHGDKAPAPHAWSLLKAAIKMKPLLTAASLPALKES